MASVTPGSLLKLLQSMSDDENPKPKPPHRPPILQITGITPASSDLSPSSGFFLRLSDSLHSTYVFHPFPDASSNLRLGQLIPITRLHPPPSPSLPLPVLPSPLHPLPLPSSSRSPPFLVGDSPQPLSLSLSLSPSSFLIHPSPPNFSPSPINVTDLNKYAYFTNPTPAAPPSRRRRSCSPAASTTRTRASPAKCALPSLAPAVKEDDARKAAAAAIVVPSRYRQPSPPVVGRRGAGVSPMAGRRLSGEGSGGGRRRRSGVFGVGKAVRKSWDENLEDKDKVKKEEKVVVGNKSKVHQQAILRTQVLQY